MMNDAARGPTEGQMAAAAVPSDPGKILPKGTGKRSVTNRDCASLQQGAALSKKRAKSSAEETTAEKNPTLGEDCLDAILAFLPVDHLVILRSLSKDTKATVDKMVQKRAPQYPPTLDLKWQYDQDCRQEKNRIMVHQGWTEELQDKESVIDFAIETSHLAVDFLQWVVHWAKDCLRKSGSADLDDLDYDSDSSDSDSSRGYRYRCEVEWNDALEVSTALQRVAKYFQHAERGVKLVSEFDSLRKIVVAKETVLSLLLTNSSQTVGFSKVKMEDYYDKENPDGVGYGTVLVFRLENDMEIYLNSYFDDNISDLYYNDHRDWERARKAYNRASPNTRARLNGMML